jgi:cell wall-associated NlpC family hydrolase
VTIETQLTGYAQAVARVREITAPLQSPVPAPPATGDFAGQLSSAMKGSPAGSAPTTAAGYTSQATAVDPVALAGGSGRGAQIAALATTELGVAEQPPGSNDGARIAQYRTATAGSGVGPWCAYFTSWVAAQAGVPVGPDGRGIGYVPTVKQWAEQTGRYIPAGSAPARVGDLVVFDRGGDGVLDHIGVVTGTSPDGSIRTVEGNSSDRVSARTYGPGGYTGLVRLVAPGG